MLYQAEDSSRDASKDFGPRVRSIPLRRRNNVRPTFNHRHRNETRDGCQLIATLAPHGGAVTAFAVAPDHAYFVSGSDDKTLKVWDTARLERNVTSQARHVYTEHKAAISALVNLEGAHCFASAAENGSIHVIRVSLAQSGSTPKYGKLKVVRRHQLTRPGDYATCLFHYLSGKIWYIVKNDAR